ncbi:Auxin transporter protein 1 [Wickerhamomyces ciferrii]|uniref:Auxin transporter protein 1 n=1 Tax=Wickerhamomyces ciferrii (strain ATCC 14091 / BCRC 22168 / CBS 111 / JCM 3599 / NBRC 0793 / NRRL Y-1031 F-60-10) TaxID=1206466 RepID=K0KE58_WICCF|nr:Auxin transporter protein 1 [Wickerhamomyces ciferrii]CCH41201.1 Auxin transporter protein 1 [Wickerhamomyces ciferrii]
MPSTNTSLDKQYIDPEKQEQSPELLHYTDQSSDSESNPDAYLLKEIEHEKDSQIKYRSCSWQKTAGLLFSEYICLAIMSFPWSYSILGLVPGLIITVFISLTVAYTGCIIGDYCSRYPHIQSICDIGQHLFWGKKWAWYATAACFILNNTLIQALHVLIGAKYLNTVSHHGACTVVFAVVSAIICCIFSLPRTFSHMSFVGIFAAATMFVAVILSIVFAAIQDHPEGFDGTPVHWNLWPEKGTTYVSGMSAMLNIVYTFVGQICYPSFISEMKNPKDFKKAIYVVTICEVLVFALAGSIVYVYAGNHYMVAPAFGVLTGKYKIAAFTFAIPTIVFLGSLYSNVSSQFIFLKVFQNSKHKSQHTVKGWGFWIALNVFFWIVAFIIAEVIPFFSDLLSLMSSLFDCWFGFVFWGVAFIRLRQDKYKGQFSNTREFWNVLKTGEKIEYIICIILILMGIYILGPGTYASVDSIVLSYQSGAYGSVFTCASNGL